MLGSFSQILDLRLDLATTFGAGLEGLREEGTRFLLSC